MDIKKLTLDEKLHLLTGRDNWRLSNANGKLPEFFMSDGPHGIRKIDDNGNTIPSIAYPTLSSLASTWNTELAYKMGVAIAEDAIERSVDLVLAPGVNIKRTPLCGRNFEYFSEDPILAGFMAKQYINGIQSKGVGTSLKHFALNNCEFSRLWLSSEVDDRTMHEIYLRAFEIAVQAKPWTVMCSYNLINGVYAAEHKKLLNDTLRNRFGFDGVIISDWSAVENRAKALKATVDVEMPYSDRAYECLKKAYENGFITDAEIDASVNRILALIQKSEDSKPNRKVNSTVEQRRAVATEVAEEAIVLLKNDDDILPIRKHQKVYVTGEKSEVNPMGGGGSAFVKTEYKTLPLCELLKLEGIEDVTYHHAFWNGRGITAVKNIHKAILDAENADVSVIVTGFDQDTDSEGYDRPGIKLNPQMEDYIRLMGEANENTVVVLHAGSAVDVSGWIDYVKALVLVNFSGEGGNNALAGILSGRVNPSGKLQESFPISLEDTPSEDYKGDGFSVKYHEGVFVGYRHYDKCGIDVAFPFGHGLSYSGFLYSDLKIEKTGECDFNVSFKITNVSEVDGKEIWQLYVGAKHSFVERPERELKGFGKIMIKAGESVEVSHKLSFRDFAYYSTAIDDWRVEDGNYFISVGASSRDISLEEEVEIVLSDYFQYSQRN